MTETKMGLMQIIQSTEPLKVISIPEVRQKFITNYEQANGKGKGELAFQKNAIIFSDLLRAKAFERVTSMQIYKIWIMIAVRGYDLDPSEGEVYIMPYGDKIELQKQAPYLLRRLKDSKQVKECFPAQLIFEGDEFEFVDGMISKHSRKLKSNHIIAGYVIMEKYNGHKVCFFYTPENWLSWKSKSKQANGENWTGGTNGQPNESFLKTKIMLHACKEKCWASNRKSISEDFFPEVESEDEKQEVPEIETAEYKDVTPTKSEQDEF